MVNQEGERRRVGWLMDEGLLQGGAGRLPGPDGIETAGHGHDCVGLQAGAGEEPREMDPGFLGPITAMQGDGQQAVDEGGVAGVGFHAGVQQPGEQIPGFGVLSGGQAGLGYEQGGGDTGLRIGRQDRVYLPGESGPGEVHGEAGELQQGGRIVAMVGNEHGGLTVQPPLLPPVVEQAQVGELCAGSQRIGGEQ